jgi:transcriptional regulator with XRE-family HTH domain
VWSWTDHISGQALRSGDLGAILRAYRRVNTLSQEKLAAALGYDKTYISMIETGRRVIHDVATRRHIARILAIPPHLLGVTDPADTEFVAMVAFAESTIRLAELARSAGRSAEAVNELWPLVARLEVRAEEGHLEQATLTVLARAWVSLGVCLGTMLPEERLQVATWWTSKGLTAARHLESQPAFTTYALQMHGNELRKAGDTTQAVTVLRHAVDIATSDQDRGAALALLARAAGHIGDGALFAQVSTCYQKLADTQGHGGPLFNPFTWREIQLRGLLGTGDHAAAFRLADDAVTCPAPAPQWQVIERITYADVLTTAGDHATAEAILLDTLGLARQHRLPHQIQRAIRIARRAHRPDLAGHASATLAQVCAEPVLQPEHDPAGRMAPRPT